jgi:hypothetical protein
MQVKMTTIDDLPDEILLTIFKHLPAEDLSMTVPLVNHRWKALSQTPSLWSHLTFTPPVNMSDKQVAHALQTMPHLKSFRLQHGKNVDLIVDALCEYCPDIQDIVMDRKRGPSKGRLAKLLTTYSGISRLNVLVAGNVLQIDYTQLYGISTPRHSSLFLFVALDPETRRRIDWEVHGGRALYIHSLPQGVELLKARREALQFLTLCSRLTSKELDVIYTCEQLRSLCLKSYDRVVTTLDLDSLTRLQNLECLQLYIHHNRDTQRSLRARYTSNMPRVVKLEIVSSFSFSNSSISRMISCCPNLQYLKIQTAALNDECFTTIDNCNSLKHIDISCNYLLTDDTVKYIANGCAELEFLDVSSCIAMTERIVSFLKPLKRIQELRLDHHKLSVQRFRSIPVQLPSVRILSIDSCSQLSAADIHDLATRYPNLQLATNPEHPVHHGEEMRWPDSLLEI